ALANANAAIRPQGLRTEQMFDAAVKRTQIVLGLEADDVIAGEIAQQLRIARQHPQHLDIRKGNVQEEAERTLHPELAQAPAERDQMIVMDPNQIARLQQW